MYHFKGGAPVVSDELAELRKCELFAAKGRAFRFLLLFGRRNVLGCRRRLAGPFGLPGSHLASVNIMTYGLNIRYQSHLSIC